eukprot:Tamp_20408.p2 GENE.Tamp_20408~~Tamp_20408.p2  ORF type:complete len:165 (-),score=13.11 Tamp_20408:510-1004(-)
MQAVDGVSCLGLASDKLADMLLGRKGTECVLLLQRSAGPVFEVKLTRQRKGEGASPAKESSSSSSSKGNVHGPGSSAKRSRQPSGSIAHAGFGFTFKRTSGSDASSWRVSRLKPKGFAESRPVPPASSPLLYPPLPTSVLVHAHSFPPSASFQDGFRIFECVLY